MSSTLQQPVLAFASTEESRRLSSFIVNHFLSYTLECTQLHFCGKNTSTQKLNETSLFSVMFNNYQTSLPNYVYISINTEVKSTESLARDCDLILQRTASHHFTNGDIFRIRHYHRRYSGCKCISSNVVKTSEA